MTVNLLTGNRDFAKELKSLSKSFASKDEALKARINEAADRFEAMYKDLISTRTGLAVAMEVLEMASKDDPDTKKYALSRLSVINERVPNVDSLPRNNANGKKMKSDELQLSIFEGEL